MYFTDLRTGTYLKYLSVWNPVIYLIIKIIPDDRNNGLCTFNTYRNIAGIKRKRRFNTDYTDTCLSIWIILWIGFTGDLSAGVNIDWMFLFLVSLFTVTGIYIGSSLTKKIPGEKLKPAFGWFVLVMGIYIMLRETIFKS